MAEVSLSDAERTFIIHGIQDNLRIDGRGSDDYRPVELETDVVSTANGSARVRLANTDILVGVKADLVTPSVEKPSQGCLEFFVDCTANANPAFEGCGGEELAEEICNTLRHAYDNTASLNLEELCVLKGSQCWLLYIDVVLLECGGNLFDAVSIAVKAALHNTKIPNVKTSKNEKGILEVDLSDDPYDCKQLSVRNAPILVTLSKIGHHHIVDANMNEEACCPVRLIVGVGEDGTIMTTKKQGSGSLDPNSVFEMIETGKMVGQKLSSVLSQKLKEEESLREKRQKKGFLGTS